MPSLSTIWAKLKSLKSQQDHRIVLPDWHKAEPPLLPRPNNLSRVDLVSADRNSDQSQCLLFSKLPKEIRLVIYEYVFGHRLIHLGLYDWDKLGCPVSSAMRREVRIRQPNPPSFTEHTRLRRFYCTQGGDMLEWGHRCWANNLYNRPKDPEEKLLEILLTCRAVYAEAIPLLYKSNVFHINHMVLVPNLSLFILPQRIDMIRKLKLNFSLEINESQQRDSHPLVEAHLQQRYLDTWVALSKLKGLSELRVCLALALVMDYSEPMWTANESWIVEPIRNFAPLQVFEIYLTSEIAIERFAQGKLDFGPHCRVVTNWRALTIGDPREGLESTRRISGFPLPIMGAPR